MITRRIEVHYQEVHLVILVNVLIQMLIYLLVQFHEYSCQLRLYQHRHKGKKGIQINTDDPGVGFESRNDRVRV